SAGTPGGSDGRYALRWDPWLPTSGLPYGLLLEFERHGLDVGAPGFDEIPYRQRVPDGGTLFIDYVTGQADIERWRAAPGAVELAHVVDPHLGPLALFLRGGTDPASACPPRSGRGIGGSGPRSRGRNRYGARR